MKLQSKVQSKAAYQGSLAHRFEPIKAHTPRHSAPRKNRFGRLIDQGRRIREEGW